MFNPDESKRFRAANRAVLREVPTDNVIPPWVLPLVRLMRGPAGGDLARAWAELPRVLPAGIAPPSVDDAAIMLLQLGLA